MDPFLAEYYGNSDEVGYDDDSLEKMAQLTLLTKEAAEEGIDLSHLTEDELYDLADEVYGGEYYDDPMEKEASDMFETADFSGRIMAHAMWNELDNIQKEAARGSRYGRRAKGLIEGVSSSPPRRLKRRKRGLRGAVADPGFSKRRLEVIAGPKAGYGSSKTTAYLRRGAEKAKHRGRQAREYMGRESTRESAKKWGGRGALAAGGLAAGVGGAAGIHALRNKESSDSAFNELVEERALEHLYASGYMDDQGNVYEPEYEKVAYDDEFEEVVDDAALEYLASLGYDIG